MLAEDDPVKMEMDIVDEQVDTLGQGSFSGLTLGLLPAVTTTSSTRYRRPTTYALAGIFQEHEDDG